MHALILNEAMSGNELRRVAIRPVHHSDSGCIADLYRRLSPESRELRFMAPQGRMSDEETWRQARRVAEGDAACQAALVVVACEPEGEAVIAVAEWVRETQEPTSAEIGLVVRDDYQRQGIGSALLRQLVQVARDEGIMTIKGYLLPHNEGIRRLLRRLGTPFTLETRRGLTTLSAPLRQA